MNWEKKLHEKLLINFRIAGFFMAVLSSFTLSSILLSRACWEPVTKSFQFDACVREYLRIRWFNLPDIELYLEVQIDRAEKGENFVIEIVSM